MKSSIRQIGGDGQSISDAQDVRRIELPLLPLRMLGAQEQQAWYHVVTLDGS
jgi:hypothetical protein